MSIQEFASEAGRGASTQFKLQLFCAHSELRITKKRGAKLRPSRYKSLLGVHLPPPRRQSLISSDAKVLPKMLSRQ